ncbi:restriction endonuclease [Ruminococcus flavefaciens]|uniref:restriction endonuclease n=1 Tax=Ruminococcus flavefaciens TaxID=1265 RepID=UPI00049023E3|nr:restriction endonuclease [Ruminococcus flavefaciens]
MAVPKFYEFLKPFLITLKDGEIHKSKEVQSILAKKMKLTDIDLQEMLPSGKQSVFNNRVAWARTYLDKAGLVETPSRGQYRITDNGKKALTSGDVIDISYLEQFDSFKKFHKVQGKNNNSVAYDGNDTSDAISPMESLDGAFKQVMDALADDLMKEVMKLSSVEFEHLVVQLLLKMGYGDGIDDAGKVTHPTSDGGIDGIIKEDQLGFSYIYIQAKQWSPDRTVSRPELQKFAGALQGEKATKGLFITTASFSSGAKNYADSLHGLTIVLVDGKQMTRLMIKYNLGVSVEHTYEVKRIDSDFFTESL